MIDRVVLYPLAGDDPPQARLIYGQDCLASLRALPDQSVHMVATSPPYWGLRDYGVEAQIGLEDTPEQYIQNLVEVFREIHRVLRDDGVAWLNLGDSYVTSMKGIGGDKGFSAGGTKRQNNRTQPKMTAPITANYGRLKVKPKDIVGIPWRVAFALQDEGWGLRQDIVWHKPNPLPESVTDRCTKAHEYIFLLTKRERYFWDQEASKEPAVQGDHPRNERGLEKAEHTPGQPPHTGLRDGEGPGGTRNKRSVWVVNPKPYPGAHFATWPPELVEPMIKAGSSEKGCCPRCQAPWSRRVRKKSRGWDGSKYGENVQVANKGAKTGGTRKSTLGSSNGKLVNETLTVDWRPTCSCNAGDPVPCTVLDPFSGSATTGAVAMRLGRNYIGLDLNEMYYDLAEARLEGRQAPDLDRTPVEAGCEVWDLFGG